MVDGAEGMVEARLVVTHAAGLHARPAALFVQTAARFAARVMVANLDRDPSREVDAKSIIGLMTLGVQAGQTIRVRAEGEAALAAVTALRELVDGQFTRS